MCETITHKYDSGSIVVFRMNSIRSGIFLLVAVDNATQWINGGRNGRPIAPVINGGSLGKESLDGGVKACVYFCL
jgi:hypothetical protein